MLYLHCPECSFYLDHQRTRHITYYTTCTYLQLHQPFGQIGCVQWKDDEQVGYYRRVLRHKVQQEVAELRPFSRHWIRVRLWRGPPRIQCSISIHWIGRWVHPIERIIRVDATIQSGAWMSDHCSTPLHLIAIRRNGWTASATELPVHSDNIISSLLIGLVAWMLPLDGIP